jgi:myxalamid-type polyketide synthase MxaE and MxaD
MRAAAGALWAAGYPLDFAVFYPEGQVVSLPRYPWQRERYWLELRTAAVVEDPSEHLYAREWRKTELPPPAAGKPRRFALVGPDVALAGALRAAGHEVVADLRSATDVVHIAALEARGTLDWHSVAKAQESGAVLLLDIVRRLESARLHVVTAGALFDSGREFRIEHGTLAGLVAAIRRERPELECRHIDVCDADPAAVAAALVAAAPDETEAVHGNVFWTPRYVRTSFRASGVELKPDATYLITGGLGGVGLEIASWMAAHGAQHIVLTGRRPAPGCGIDIPCVRYIPADVTDSAATKRLIESIAAELPPLRGIVHAAAVVDDALIADTTPEKLLNVLAPKAAGALNLHVHTTGVPLDFFILCSSIAAVLPQPGHAPYSAANAFLDSFAVYRRSLGLPATSVEWGKWSDIGLAKGEGARNSNSNYIDCGIRPLSTDLALGILAVALRSSHPLLFAAPVTWSRFATAWPGAPRMFSELTGSEAAKTTEPASVQLRDPQAVHDHVREQVGAVLKMPASKIDVRKPLGTMGLDSLLSLEFVRRLSASTGLKLPATIVFNYPTVAALAAELTRRLSPEIEAPAPVNTACAAIPAVMEAMSEEEALLDLMARPGSNP